MTDEEIWWYVFAPVALTAGFILTLVANIILFPHITDFVNFTITPVEEYSPWSFIPLAAFLIFWYLMFWTIDDPGDGI